MLFRSEPISTQGLGIFEGIADKIVVLSLPQAEERRSRLPGHLAEFGITRFEWHDAFAADHPKVQALYDQNLVATFPPCFRCGKETCDCENNVLIPQQVANFASHLDIWEKASKQDQRVLVMEDDVVIHPWAMRTMQKLRRRVAQGKIAFDPRDTMLLRMGWAKSRNHRPFQFFRAKPVVEMSNPCYAITPGFAEKLVRNFERVDSTSDDFIHDRVADKSDSLSIYPPIVSELSWSEGSVDSYIHPKENRLAYLREHNLNTEHADHEQRLRQHVKRMYSRPILCVGHPRTGTGFVAELCSKAGLDIGHEAGGADGISSWMFAVEADENPWALNPVARTRRALHWSVMIQTVRDPATAIPSIMRENEHAPASYDFRREHILAQTGTDLDKFEQGIERAIASLCLWARIIREQNPDFVCRIEYDAEALIDFLHSKGFNVSKDNLDLEPVNAEKLYKGVHHKKPDVSTTEWGNIGSAAKDLLAEYCEAYNYKMPV
ncbi:glycosyltransferase family 25 protein [Ruegeria lacuscaerulensis]|uniref:glycosyltransferase family 25 protein n=1 Tax=Ruegeria lacuscaerulensis TaxID=55218 RepID=UPI00147D858F|nr:glycosyltransferase family 25 protein [Ruegeria lacuscaerulensis]